MSALWVVCFVLGAFTAYWWGRDRGERRANRRHVDAKETGWQQGYRDGMNEGRIEGYDLGHNEGQHLGYGRGYLAGQRDASEGAQ